MHPTADIQQVLVGDELSRSCTAIGRLQERGYDLFTRRQYGKAREVFQLVERHARNAQIVLGAQGWLDADVPEGELLARQAMDSYDRSLGDLERQL